MVLVVKVINDDDDDHVHCIEHRRHKIVSLDKKQGWCHIIVYIT